MTTRGAAGAFSLRRYPAVALLVPFSAGIAVSLATAPSGAVSAVALGLGLLCALCAAGVGAFASTRGRPCISATILVMTALALTGSALPQPLYPPQSPPALSPHRVYELSATVRACWATQSGAVLSLDDAEVGGVVSDAPLFLTLPSPLPAVAGQRVRCICRVQDAAGWLMPVGGVVVAATDGVPLLIRLRTGFANALDSSLEPAEASLVKAVLLGRRQELPPDVREPYNLSGNGHLLAISGLHFGLLLGAVLWLLRLLAVGPRIAWPTVGVVGLFMLAVVGFAPPAARAAIMVVAMMTAVLAGRRHNALNALCLAALAILLFEPRALAGASFQLSFGALAGIVLVGLPLSDRISAVFDGRSWLSRTGKGTANALIVSLSAWAFTTPLIAHYFGVVSPQAFVSALVTVPALAATLITGFLAGAVHLVSDGGLALAGPATVCAKALTALNSLCAVAPGSHAFVVPPGAVLTMAMSGLLAVGGWMLSDGRKRLALAAFACLAVLCLLPRGSQTGIMEIGDRGPRLVAAVHGGRVLVFDGGNRSWPSLRASCVRYGLQAPRAVIRMNYSRNRQQLPVPELRPWSPPMTVGEEGAGYFKGHVFELPGIRAECVSPPAHHSRIPAALLPVLWQVRVGDEKPSPVSNRAGQ